MSKEKLSKICCIVAGIVFLLSGIGKSLATSNFVELIMSYGFRDFGFAAPFIAWIEIIIGLALVFRLYPKQTSFVVILFLVSVSCIYVYGYFRHHITDCGCFGVVSNLNKMPPILIIIRNLLLIIMLSVVYKQTDFQQYHITQWMIVVIICMVSLSSFFMGYTYYPPFVSLNDNNSNYEGKTLAETPLSNFTITSKDSTYLLFVFSYTCPHCLNSIENLNQYEKTNTVDRVIGLAVEDTTNEATFRQHFNPLFSIKNYDYQRIKEIVTAGFPTLYYIKNDTVFLEMTGEALCVYNFTNLINNK